MTYPKPTKMVALCGSFSKASKTRALLQRAADLATERFGLQVHVLELADFLPSLGLAQTAEQLDPVARERLDQVIGADALIVGTPVYKGSYTGLFKHLIDLIEPSDLAGKPILLTATGGGAKHALVIEHQLRPLFGFFEAATLPTGVYASSADFIDGQLASSVLVNRLGRAVEQFSPWLGQAHHQPKQTPRTVAA